ncbi:MAG: outer membrane lipoprotein-sorting protein [Owenweeksia sp.]|nr:outer membrane lipoprotein-sorting protein [Owenweeksia sp.]MBF99193.1 outer membrane lipoprotein-sorting protein [Owenweeksia sp.]HBF22011.1 outer membrane lipoprotein-sorting protein [Cryomorphaceae bacterium]HCQ16490.1 outer membrane lipoprotein-sorting protein [Cryomorphaceae bacterium]|tara:strand:- start:284 stop:1024 length:741 start_codon:yes stop_codon:yes gene_type:complete
MKHLSTLFLLLSGFLGYAQDATEIIRKSENKLRGDHSSGTVQMTIERPNWSRTMTMKTWSRGTEYSMILVTEPARDQGTVYLKRKSEIWNWVPSVERTIKLPPSMMSQSWMGSDFTNDDLVQESSILKDYTHKLLGEETIRGTACYKIQLTPKEDAAVVWGKVISWISKDDYLQLKTEFYDEDGELVNTMEGFEIKELGGRRLPSKLVMTPANEPGNRTIMRQLELNFDDEQPEGFYTTQNMKRIR